MLLQGRDRPDISTFLSLFEHKIRESTQLTRQESQAVCIFLLARVPQFAPFANNRSILRQLVNKAHVLCIEGDDEDELPHAAEQELMKVRNELDSESHVNLLLWDRSFFFS